MNFATKKQVGAINAILAKNGLMDVKAEIIKSASSGRTESSRMLSTQEAWALLQQLAKPAGEQRNDLMSRKLFAMAHEIGWIPRRNYITPEGQMMENADYTKLQEWVLKYGYLKKNLRQYTHDELPKLLSQFEFGPYKHYISKPTK